MRQPLLVLGLGFILSAASPAIAVQRASVGAGDNVAWSKVIENPFDGKIVYDRNYKDDFVFVSSWARKGIGVTYSQVRTTLVGYDYRPSFDDGYYFRHRRRGLGLFSGYQVPIYQRYLTENVPDSISLAINGQVYTYEAGPVSPELAAALASAPPGNVMIRLNWKDGRTKDTEIGKDTVKAWKTIFGQL